MSALFKIRQIQYPCTLSRLGKFHRPA